MKTKITKIFMVLSLVVITMMMWTNAEAQTAHFGLDSLQNGKIKYCLIDYPSGVWLHKLSTAQTGIRWTIQNPTYHDIYCDSVLLTSANNGPIWFRSNQTTTLPFNFYLVNGPVNQNLPDINTCGTIFSYVVNSGNNGIDASWLWNSGTTTMQDTITTASIKWVTIANGCGVAVTDSFEVIVDHTNDANLGLDDTICLGDTVTLSTGNNNIVSYHWSTNATDSILNIWQTGIYSVTTTDNNGCVSDASMDLFIEFPYTQQELCMATFDTISYKNMLSWEQHLGENIDSIGIEKEISLNTWEIIGVVDNTTTTFLDGDSAPQTNSNKYRIFVIGCNNNRSLPSFSHTTITLITSYTPGTNIMGFNWSHYLINDALIAPNYTIYGIDQNNIVHIIGIVSGSQNYFNWINPDLTYIKFFIGFQLSCGAKTSYFVRSNYKDNPVTSINELLTHAIKIYPVPSTGPITIETDLTIKNIEVYNTLGQVILTTQEKNFDIFYKGMYFIHIYTKMGVLVQKIVIQ